MSANDKKVLREIMDQVSGMEINSTEDLSQFVDIMTNFENHFATVDVLDDPKMVLSTLSVMKYSRSYWYWYAISKGGGSTGY